MKNIFRVLPIIYLLFYSAACVGATRPISATSEPNGTDSSIIRNTPTLTELAPTHTPVYTSTSTPKPQNSPTVTVISTSALESEVKERCLTSLSELPENKKYSGQIIQLNEPGNHYSFLNLKTGEKDDIRANNKQMISDLVVSPDRTLYAYALYKSHQMVIVSDEGKIKQISALPNSWYLTGWHDDKRLLFEISEPDPSFDQNIRPMDKYPRTLALLNLFTGEKQILPPDYPDINQTTWGIDFEGSGTTVYNLKTDRVVYVGATEEAGFYSVILWDIPNKKRLAQLPLGTGTVPKWLPDGSKYIMVAQDGFFYLVTQDGTVTQVTHVPMDVLAYSWSPDNQHVAFWLYSSEPKDRTLNILDTFTGQITNFCISAGYNPMGSPVIPVPIWSPDGSSMIIEANFNKITQGSDLMLLDLNDNTAAKIGENTSPVGWLKDPEE